MNPTAALDAVREQAPQLVGGAASAVWSLPPGLVVFALAIVAGILMWVLRNPIATFASLALIIATMLVALPGGIPIVRATMQQPTWSEKSECLRAAVPTVSVWQAVSKPTALDSCKPR